MRTRILFLLLAAVALPAAARDFAVSLVEPAAGEELAAGSAAVVAWNAVDAPANVEEWEAFVSLDGGRTYPLRVTPHLDTAIRRFQWTVPDLPGAEVTLMLRFGDEQDERGFVFRPRARITGLAGPLAMLRRAPAFRPTPGAEEGVVDWVEGGRDGSALREVSVVHSFFEQPDRTSSPRDDEASAPATIPSCHDRAVTRRAPALDAPIRVAATSIAAVAQSTPDILLLSTRLNV